MHGIVDKVKDITKYIPEKLDPLIPAICMVGVMADVQEYLLSTPEEREKKLYESLKAKYEESQ
jgi:hypothetical protein